MSEIRGEQPEQERETTKKEEQPENPYKSEESLIEFIKTKRRPIDYSSIIEPDCRVLAFGESHRGLAEKKEVIDSLKQLKNMGFTHLGLEFLGVEMQEIIDRYLLDKNEKDREAIWDHLKTWSWGEIFFGTYLEIMEEAQKLGIKVVGLDMPQREKDFYQVSEEIELQQRRNPFMAKKVRDILFENPRNRVITFTGSGHIQNVDEGDGSMVLNLREDDIKIITVDLSIRIHKPPHGGQYPNLEKCAQKAGVENEKFMLASQSHFPDSVFPFDYLIYLPE